MTAWTAKFIQSFCHALNGVGWALKTQRHLKIHALAALVVTSMGFVNHLAVWEWCCISLCIGLVWMAELFNTALEVLCDRVTQEQDEFIRRVKDVSAGAVLIAAIAAAFVAILIFL